MRTETDPTETQGEWKPLGSPTNRPKTEPDEWQKVPDAPGVEYNWKTGKTRTNMPLPSAWVEDLAMQAKDEPARKLSKSERFSSYQNISLDECMQVIATLTQEQSEVLNKAFSARSQLKWTPINMNPFKT